ncbi:MAG: hypothetical protein OEW62_00750 [Candidatus Bathyarchaeota archaeon]|nr:hypothetical protein [Candidatus Bathyarchaeota archaeon]MDH5745422.1 hypothetical protein [Candidatus Bathyarchaeota archaeon]
MKASIIKRIEKLEEQFKPCEPELPPVDLDLLIKSESEYFSKQMVLLRTKARELGYGDKNNKVGWFDLGSCDPVCNEEVRMECLEALNDEEVQIIETLHKIIEKCIRLTALLTEDEKEAIKQYNYMTVYLRYGWTGRYDDCEAPSYTQDEYEEARLLYEQIMAKHGEKIYE